VNYSYVHANLLDIANFYLFEGMGKNSLNAIPYRRFGNNAASNYGATGKIKICYPIETWKCPA